MESTPTTGIGALVAEDDCSCISLLLLLMTTVAGMAAGMAAVDGLADREKRTGLTSVDSIFISIRVASK